MNMRRDLDPLRVKFGGGLRNLRARGLRDSGEILKFHLSAGGWDYGALIAPPRPLNLRAR